MGQEPYRATAGDASTSRRSAARRSISTAGGCGSRRAARGARRPAASARDIEAADRPLGRAAAPAGGGPGQCGQVEPRQRARRGGARGGRCAAGDRALHALSPAARGAAGSADHRQPRLGAGRASRRGVHRGGRSAPIWCCGSSPPTGPIARSTASRSTAVRAHFRQRIRAAHAAHLAGADACRPAAAVPGVDAALRPERSQRPPRPPRSARRWKRRRPISVSQARDVIPCCLAASVARYNVDAVWAAISERLPDAQRARLVRTLRDAERRVGSRRACGARRSAAAACWSRRSGAM